MSYEISQGYCQSTTVIRAESLLNTPKAVLEVLKHFMSAIRSLINSPSKLCRVDERTDQGDRQMAQG